VKVDSESAGAGIPEKKIWKKPEISGIGFREAANESYDGNDGTMGGYDS
jgi:hypothetical protein